MVVNKEIILLISLIGLNICEGEYGLDGLGARISESVQKSLSPLRNVGPNLERELAPLNNLGNRIKRQVDESLEHVRRIGPDLEQQLAPLNNLGERISQQVYEGLKPVRILQSIMKVTQGTDGTTIATFSPNNKKFIIRDGVLYECDGGSISDENGSCSGTLKPYSFDKKEDFCYTSSKSRINNWYCLSTGYGVNTNIINGKISCYGVNNNPTLLITVDEYKTLCENVAQSVRYKYFTNNKIEEFGNGLSCTGDKPQICTFSSTIDNNDNVNTVLTTSDERVSPNSGQKFHFSLTFSLQLLFSVIVVLVSRNLRQI